MASQITPLMVMGVVGVGLVCLTAILVRSLMKPPVERKAVQLSKLVTFEKKPKRKRPRKEQRCLFIPNAYGFPFSAN